MEEEILYHYTSVETLFNILNNTEKRGEAEYIKLRASYFMNMNDPIDCRYFFSEVKQILAEENASKDCKDKIENTILDVGIPYIISLSSAKDSLPMWNMYAQKGHGVSIGLSKKVLDDATHGINNRGGKRQRTIASSCFCKLYECKYWDTNDIKEKFVQKYILDKTDFNNKITNNDICSISYLIKHPSFFYEKESRVVFLYSPYPKLHGCLEHIDFLLPISSIRKIICGPCIKREMVEAIIPSTFNKIITEESKIPYTDSSPKRCPLSLLFKKGFKE